MGQPIIKLTESEKNWLKDYWEKHWDEIILIGGTVIFIIGLLRMAGKI